jgi:rhodanese-related sulfurtransferase
MPIPSILPREAAARLDGTAEAGTDADARRPLLVDVRERDEFRTVRVPGAVLVPVSEFAARMADLPRDRPLLILCASGSRSQMVADYLLRVGYSDVTNVVGGIAAWRASGLPMRTGPVDVGEGELARAE